MSPHSPLQLLPAVDIADGQAMRMTQGEVGSETFYGGALDAALVWQRDGASWIHLVDVDAAFGRGSNADISAGVVRSLDVDVLCGSVHLDRGARRNRGLGLPGGPVDDRLGDVSKLDVAFLR